MAKARECLIEVGLALSLREFLTKHGWQLAKGDFLCKACKRPVKPMVKSTYGAAHFEHFRRNLSCPLSDKRTPNRAYSEYKARKAGSSRLRRSE